MLDELDGFTALDGRKFHYVKMQSPDIMMVWEALGNKLGWYNARCGGLDIRDINAETLKRINVWDELTPEIQKEITEGISKKTQAVHDLLKKARAGRKNKYPGVPRELECIKCHKKIAIQPSVLVGRVEKITKDRGIAGLTYVVDDYVKSWECVKCSPNRRGRVANPEFANLPKEMICKCGNKMKVQGSQLKKKAEKLNKTIEEVIREYVCQECSPVKRGRPRTK